MADFRDPRMSERKFYRIEPLALTSNGTIDGIVKVSNTYAIKVGQKVTIRSNTQQPRVLKVKGVLSETDILIGAFDTPITKGTDLTDFLVTDSAEVVVPEQKRPAIDPVDIQGMVFDEEPTIALRSHLVDWLGRSYEMNNPMPVQLSDGSIDIGTVNAQIEIQSTHRDNYPEAGDEHDSIRIGGASGNEANTTSDDRLKVSPVASPYDDTKNAITCADDVQAEYTFQEINGVRRITEIKWTSNLVASELGLSSASVTRVYTYENSDPYDLVNRSDTLSLLS